jgi:hypothetical protein
VRQRGRKSTESLSIVCIDERRKPIEPPAVCTFRQISGLKSQAPTRPITYMRVMRGEGLAGGSAETSLATARPFASPHGSERHWSARQRLPRSKVSRWFD